MEMSSAWERLGERLGELSREAARANELFLDSQDVQGLSDAEGDPFQHTLEQAAGQLDAVLGETVRCLKSLSAAMQAARESSKEN
jgi:hypothetical protein